MSENVLFSTRFCVDVSMRFITTAVESRFVNPSNWSPSSISMSCMRTSNALSTSVSMASPYVTEVGPLPRKSPTRTMVYVKAPGLSSAAFTRFSPAPFGTDPSSAMETSPAATRTRFSASNHLSKGAPPSFASTPMTPVPTLVLRFMNFHGSTSRRHTPMCDSSTNRLRLGHFPAATAANTALVSSSTSGAYSLAMMIPVALARTWAYATSLWSTHSTASSAERQSIIGRSGYSRSFAMAFRGFLTPT
mmetsp:Transcript_11658/g.48879  ORF Transcript_11658/g.48879 Transcript_11658/m.48879 type:complete len:248 (+) Transcript_11658:1502-2245(+)